MATRAPDTLTPAGAWAAHALCRFDDPKLYFTDSGTGAALATCRTCRRKLRANLARHC